MQFMVPRAGIQTCSVGYALDRPNGEIELVLVAVPVHMSRGHDAVFVIDAPEAAPKVERISPDPQADPAA
jgi:hypothetical protein